MKKIIATILGFSLANVAFAQQVTDWIPEATKMNNETVQDANVGAKEVLRKRGTLSNGATAQVPLKVRAGYHYTIFGDCSFACKDLDLSLMSGPFTVASDTDEDSSPIISYHAQSNATVDIIPDMIRCESNKCDYQVQVFESKRPVFND